MQQYADIAERYRQVNESFPRKLVWRVGQQAGFFAEYSAMLSAMVYCLDHHLQLQLYSADANFGTGKGWTEYFLPFCPEVSERFHERYNVGRAPSWCHLLRVARKERSPRLLLWKCRQLLRGLCGRLLAWRVYGERVLLSDSVQPDYDKEYDFPALHLHGSFLEMFRAMVEITWHMNEETQRAVDILVHDTGLEEQHYVGCQVRGGDKVTESKLIGSDDIAQQVAGLSAGEPVFVLTDDYRLYCRLKEVEPKIQWLTLCQTDEQGYVNSAFTKTSAEEKHKAMTRFLATMQLLMHCRLFVGSITTGPSVFLMKMRFPAIHAVDCPKELLPSLLFTDIGTRARISSTPHPSSSNS